MNKILIILMLLTACSTTVSYTGAARVPQIRERISHDWKHTDHVHKLVWVDNPYYSTLEVDVHCGWSGSFHLAIPPRSTKTLLIEVRRERMYKLSCQFGEMFYYP